MALCCVTFVHVIGKPMIAAKFTSETKFGRVVNKFEEELLKLKKIDYKLSEGKTKETLHEVTHPLINT